MAKWIELNNEIMRRDQNGQFQLHKDLEARDSYLAHIKSKSMKFKSEVERLRFLVKESYYYDLFSQYTEEQVLELTDYARSFKFNFKSFMAASKFYDTYALKTRDEKDQQLWLEDFDQHNVIVALFLAEGDMTEAKNIIKAHSLQTFQTATPTYLNSGRGFRGELASCYLFTMDDSLNSINFVDGQVSQASKIAGGCAVNLTRMRGRGASVNGAKGASKGIIPIAKKLEHSLEHIDQNGARNGAGAAYLHIFHSDVVEFLNAKKVNADEDLRLATLSTGLVIPDLFFKLAREDRPFYMFEPHSIQLEYGEDVVLDDIDLNVWYDRLVENKNVKKHSMPARDMLNLIAKIQLQSGYPYIMYKDNANKNHALNDLGEVKMSNLCTEIFQLMHHSKIADYGKKDELGQDIICNLGSLNMVSAIENNLVEESIRVGIRTLSTVAANSRIEHMPTVHKANVNMRAVGLGAMSFHSMCAKNKIRYGSEESLDLINIFTMLMDFYSLDESMKLAVEHTPFTGFEKSDYKAKDKEFGEFFYNNGRVTEDVVPATAKVAAIFKDIRIPTKEDWQELARKVDANGIYNALNI